jgi:hypothetical protein
MSEYVPAPLRRLVRDRANGRCEYCLLHEDDALMPHEPDHIIAVKHRGETNEDNLAWTCFVCNRAKGSDLSSVDTQTKSVVRLFNPRTDQWDDHFEMDASGRLIAKTDVGRVTEFLLKINRPELIEIRSTLSQIGRKRK